MNEKEKKLEEIQKLPLKARIALLQIDVAKLMRIFNVTPRDYMNHAKICVTCAGKFDTCPKCGERVSLGALTCFSCGRILVKRHEFDNPTEQFSRASRKL